MEWRCQLSRKKNLPDHNSEWRMNATITNDTGTVIQTYTFGTKLGSDHCMKKTKLNWKLALMKKAVPSF